MAEPISQQTFAVGFSSTNDPDRDAELILLEDDRHTLEEVQAICRRYGVIALVSVDGRVAVAGVAGDGTVAWR